MNTRVLIFTLLALSGWLVGNVRGQTLSPSKLLGRYQQLVWQDQHGLPSNRINAMVRTRDGYLWLATLEGAARFDGVRFTVFDNSNTPELSVSTISALLEDRAVVRPDLRELVGDPFPDPLAVLRIHPVVRVAQRVDVPLRPCDLAGRNLEDLRRQRRVEVSFGAGLNLRVAALLDERR